MSAVQVRAGERMELADLRGKLVQRGGISAAPIDQQLGDAARAAHGGSKAIGKKMLVVWLAIVHRSNVGEKPGNISCQRFSTSE